MSIDAAVHVMQQLKKKGTHSMLWLQDIKNSWDNSGSGGITRRAAVILLKKKKTSQILLRSLVKENKKDKKNEKTIEVKNHENPLINYIYDIYNKKNNTLYNILIIYI